MCSPASGKDGGNSIMSSHPHPKDTSRVLPIVPLGHSGSIFSASEKGNHLHKCKSSRILTVPGNHPAGCQCHVSESPCWICTEQSAPRCLYDSADFSGQWEPEKRDGAAVRGGYH